MNSRLVLLSVSALVMVAALAGCSDDDDEESDHDDSSTSAALALCRTVAVADASLSSTRRQIARGTRGNVDNQVLTSYAFAIDLVAGPASDPAVPAELASRAVALIETFDLSRVLAAQVEALGIQPEVLSRALVAEARAVSDLTAACAEEVPGAEVASPSATQSE